MKKMTNNKFNLYEEQINSIINTNALLLLLNKKNIINANEFTQAKEEALEEFQKEFPELFK